MDGSNIHWELQPLLKHFSLRNAHYIKATISANDQGQIHQQLLEGILGPPES